jgi:AraC-like DNA-binding protein
VLGRVDREDWGLEPGIGADAGLHSLRLGPMTFWKVDRHAYRDGRLSDLLPADSRDLVKVVLQLDGEVRVEKGGRTTVLRPGSWGLYGLSRSCNVFHIDSCTRQLIIVMPRRELTSRNPAIARVMQRQFPSESPTCALAFHFLTSLHDSVADDSAFRQELANVAIHLLQVALAEQVSESCYHSERELFRSRIISYVDLNLRNPELSVRSVAKALHCSSRYLQKVFGGDEGLSRYIWRTRLERCREALGDPGKSDLSITRIAFSFGFSNASHFSRAFRERFGVSPRDFRTTALRAQDRDR